MAIEGRAAGPTADSLSHCRALERFLAEAVADGLRVVVYDAMAGEVDLGPLVDRHPDPAARFALTRTPSRGHELTVHPWGVPLEHHRYGYRQPAAGAVVAPDASIGAMLVPGLAFDRHGTRLGHGMGYYDRLLGRFSAEVLFIGITGGFVVEALPADRHDVAMTHLATAAGVHAVPLDDAVFASLG